MSALSTTTKARLGARAAKRAARHPKLALRGVRTGAPAVRGGVKLYGRARRRRVAEIIEAGRRLGETVVTVTRQDAQDETARARPKRTLPHIGIGVVIGAAAMYFLEPTNGPQRRRTVSRMIANSGAASHRDDGAGPGGPAHPAPGHLPPDPHPDPELHRP